MKITNTRTEEKCKFYELCPGDVFKYKDNVFMKIDKINDHCYKRKNAVCLNVACVHYIDEDYEVVKLKAELLIL